MDRRTFAKTGATAMLALPAAGAAIAQASPNERVGVGFI